MTTLREGRGREIDPVSLVLLVVGILSLLVMLGSLGRGLSPWWLISPGLLIIGSLTSLRR